jgi:hypothetical protein
VQSTGNLREALIAKTLRVPAADGARGDGAAAARQLDVALLSVGFKCSRELLEHLSGRHPAVARDAGEVVLRAVRELVGDHVRHNVYFVDFPANVPDTLEFWAACIADALKDERSAGNIARQLADRFVNLLDLPRYGRYQHTYEEMLAAHDELVPAAADRVTVLALGGTFAEESHALYLALAGSPVPLVESDLALLGALAELHVSDAQPDEVPMRENRALINRARVPHDMPLMVDTATDVLRLACALSDGDVTLSTPTRLRSLRRPERRRLLAALDDVIRASPAKLADVRRHAEPFKRLGERLHPHEYPQWEAAQNVFAVARGEREARSLGGRVELALADGDVSAAVRLLTNAPGMLLRAVDRLARAGAGNSLVGAVRDAAPSASTRVLLSLREHLLNRAAPVSVRVFVNREGRAWATADERAPVPAATRDALEQVLDEELIHRLPPPRGLVIEPAMRAVAVPLSDRTRPNGLGILPRGSVLPVGERVRFFVHWKERERRTDYDLSVLLLDDDFHYAGQVSWTNLQALGAVHSGDITEAPNGASEFIDLDLGRVAARFVVGQVNIYSGESFDTAEEAFFGFMQREADQTGRPFEPRTVRAKSDLFGRGRVALPVLFARGDDGWHALWLHVNLAGSPNFNRVEGNRDTTSQLVRAIVERRYLTVAYLEDLLLRNGGVTRALDGDEPITYLGFDRPEELPPGSAVFTPANLPELLNPA